VDILLRAQLCSATLAYPYMEQGPLPTVPGVIRMHFAYVVGSAPAGGWRVYMQYANGVADAAFCNAAAAHAGGQWSNYMAAVTNQDFNMARVYVQDLSSKRGADGIWTTGSQGTLSGFPAPMSVCGLINWNIDFSYRGGKPRTYIPLGGDVESGPQKWETGFHGQAQTAITAFFNALKFTSGTTTLTEFVCVHFYSGAKENTTGGKYDPKYVPMLDQTPAVDRIYNPTLNPIVGSQRRRLRLGPG